MNKNTRRAIRRAQESEAAKQRHKEWSCYRKIRYEWKEQAEQYILDHHPPASVYHCVYCEGWHLTTKGGA